MGGDIGEIQLGSERELCVCVCVFSSHSFWTSSWGIYKYINHYAVAKKKTSTRYSKIILVQVNIIFALPDYSSEVVERHQNLFYGRLINLALEFDIHQHYFVL